jgi:hypothetical protein
MSSIVRSLPASQATAAFFDCQLGELSRCRYRCTNLAGDCLHPMSASPWLMGDVWRGSFTFPTVDADILIRLFSS